LDLSKKIPLNQRGRVRGISLNYLGVKTPVQGGETGDDSHHLYAQIGLIEKSSIVQNYFWIATS
jgi:hypothetical protein